MTQLQKLFTITERLLRRIGIRRGMCLLDFGCGGGIYSLAAASFIMPRGQVYAIDSNPDALRTLRQRARRLRIGNIHASLADGSCDLSLPSRTVDFVLLFDVLHDHYFNAEQRADLFGEVRRVLKPNGRVAVFPNHMPPDRICDDIIIPLRYAGLIPSGEVTSELVHDEKQSEGTLLLFQVNPDSGVEARRTS